MIDDAIVYIVDDDAGMGASLQSLLASVGYRTRCFPSAELFLADALDDGPACLILDVRLRGQSGLELQRELARRGADLPVIFITGHGDVPMSVAAMKAGALEFLTKPFRDQDLLDAVHKGIEQSRKRRDAEAELSALRQRHAALTPRERQVLTLVAASRGGATAADAHARLPGTLVGCEFVAFHDQSLHKVFPLWGPGATTLERRKL